MYIYIHILSHLSSVRLCQAPLSKGFSRQEYWSRLPCPSPGDLPDPGIEPMSPHCRRILYQLSYQGRPLVCLFGLSFWPFRTE